MRPHQETTRPEINVAKLLQPKATHARLTKDEIDERNRRKTENVISVAKWRIQTSKEPARPSGGENFPS